MGIKVDQPGLEAIKGALGKVSTASDFSVVGYQDKVTESGGQRVYEINVFLDNDTDPTNGYVKIYVTSTYTAQNAPQGDPKVWIGAVGTAPVHKNLAAALQSASAGARIAAGFGSNRLPPPEPTEADRLRAELDASKAEAKAALEAQAAQVQALAQQNEDLARDLQARVAELQGRVEGAAKKDDVAATQAEIDDTKRLITYASEFQALSPRREFRVKTRADASDIVIQAPTPFPPRQTALDQLPKANRDKIKAALDMIADLLIRDQSPVVSVEIAGYTDTTGNAENNQTLSEQRAASLHAYLIAQVRKKLQAKGMEGDALEEAVNAAAGRIKPATGFGSDRSMMDTPVPPNNEKGINITVRIQSSTRPAEARPAEAAQSAPPPPPAEQPAPQPETQPQPPQAPVAPRKPAPPTPAGEEDPAAKARRLLEEDF